MTGSASGPATGSGAGSSARPAGGLGFNRGAVTLAVMLATVMQVLDQTIANVALPHIMGSVSATADQITWVLTAYIVSAALITPATGWLSLRYGRKRVFLASVILFTAASALCGAATSLTGIVLFRVLQGLGGAALIPLSQAILLDINPPEKHGEAMATWSAAIMVAPILGPTLGGWLTDAFSWRWVFLVNVPLGGLACAGIWLFVPETTRDTTRRFDLLGFTFLSIAIGALQLFLDTGQSRDWFESDLIKVEAAASALCLYLFLVHSATARGSLFSGALFRDRNFVACTTIGFFMGLIMNATMAQIPTFLQTLMRYPVITTGVTMIPRGVATMITMAIIGRLVGRTDSRVLVALGLVALGGSQWVMTGASLEMDWVPVILSGVLQGLGAGMIFVPISAVAFSTLAFALRTEASAIYSLARSVGGSIGIAATQVLLVRNTQTMNAALVEHVRADNPVARLHGLEGADFHNAGLLARLAAQIERQAAMIAYVNNFTVLLVIGLAVMPLLLLIDSGRHRRPSEEALAVE